MFCKSVLFKKMLVFYRVVGILGVLDRCSVHKMHKMRFSNNVRLTFGLSCVGDGEGGLYKWKILFGEILLVCQEKTWLL
jgi:hypothetical protein